MPRKPLLVPLGGVTLALHEVPASVMSQLIRADGKVVSPSELYSWPVSDPAASAKVIVSTVLRPALTESGAPARIESVHGKGYRLIRDK